MISKITEEELLFMEGWHTPRCLVECLFSNLKDEIYSMFNEKRSIVRLYQRFFLSQESLIDWETTAKRHNLKEKEIFRLKKRVGDCYNLGARKYGKSVFMKLNIILSALFDAAYPTAFWSVDEPRLRKVLEHVENAFIEHPIISQWDFECKYAPGIKFTCKSNYWSLVGVNINLKGKNPGHHFYSLHVPKLFGDEVSFETETVFNARRESGAEVGCIEIFAGMTNFVKTSSIGRIFSNKKKQRNIINYPQYVNPYWNQEEKEERLTEWGGAGSLNYRIFVKGEIIEEGTSAINMQLVEDQCYKKKVTIKNFELKRDQFPYFEKSIVVTRPKNAERIFVCGDVGDASRTEITIFSEVGDIFPYLYNITLYAFHEKEQYKILKWLIYKLGAEVVAIDCGDALGRGICDRLEDIFPVDNIVRYDGKQNIKVGIERGEDGKFKFKDGKPIFREERMAVWGVEHMKKMLYNGEIKIPFDYKLDNQLRYVIQIKGANGIKYKCVSSQGDHMFDAFKVFSIAHWIKKDFPSEYQEFNEEANVGEFVAL